MPGIKIQYSFPDIVPTFQASIDIKVEKTDFFGMAADGTRNYENWNVAHVAAYHDDFKLLSFIPQRSRARALNHKRRGGDGLPDDLLCSCPRR